MISELLTDCNKFNRAADFMMKKSVNFPCFDTMV